MIKQILNTLLPHRCLVCEAILDGERGLCPSCWARVRFIAKPYCNQCGVPLEFDVGEEALCGECAKGDVPYDRGRSVFVYDDGSKDMILKFKHGDAQYGAPIYAQWLVNHAQDLVAQTDVLVPVPIHWTRLFSRTYNQANLISAEMAKMMPHSLYLPQGLVRARRTSSQGHLTRTQRESNVQGSIQVRAETQPQIMDKNVMVVDDVMTSGATLKACAKALRRKGAEAVFVVTLGRVVKI